jgi:RNA polymerase-binding transcription factor DksA
MAPDLTVERARLLDQIADLTAEFQAIVASVAAESPDDEHDPDGSTSGFERQRVAALLEHARTRLAALDEALVRLAAGVYGRCEVCGEPIGAERLEALPTATRCVSCASS